MEENGDDYRSLIMASIQQIKEFDIGAIERALADAWQATAAEYEGEEALLRARAANLIIFLPGKAALEETRHTVAELTSMHPCRVLVLVGDRGADNKDIEVYISASCPEEKRRESRLLCCEEITLSAAGDFVSELPSAAVPLLIPDLPVFLWWCDVLRFDEKVFETILARVDRLIIDSADFQDSPGDLAALARVLADDVKQTTTVSDINWERLTPWRASLANFYDVPSYREELNRISRLRIEYVAQGSSSESQAAQPFLIAGWLASRLGWEFVRETTAPPPELKRVLQFAKDDRSIEVELNPSQAPALKPGRILRIELTSSGDQPGVFQVHRSADGEYLESSVNVGVRRCPGSRVRFRNLSITQLLSREMEILGDDKIYEEAVRLAEQIS